MKLPRVTVVIPAFNEEIVLSTCLDSLRYQDYEGEMEILVVDNNSSDRTSQIALAKGCKVVFERNKGYNNAIRTGFSNATGDIIACTDADTMVESDWVSRIVKILSNNGVAACSGVFRFFDGSPFIRGIGHVFGRFNYHLAGANMGIWKHIYLKSGGFSESINLGADVELGLRVKKLGKVVIDRSLVVHTSSRRFHMAFWETVFRYYLNDLSLYISGKPLFYSFKNYRIPNDTKLHEEKTISVIVPEI